MTMDSLRWEKLTFAEQMGNIGSEIARAKHWQEKGYSDDSQKALIRALDLLMMTIADTRWIKRCRELTRIKEVLGSWVVNAKYFDITYGQVIDYCTRFSLK